MPAPPPVATTGGTSPAATFQSIVALDAALKAAVEDAESAHALRRLDDPRDEREERALRKLEERRDVLEVKTEMLAWWGTTVVGCRRARRCRLRDPKPRSPLPQFTGNLAKGWAFIGFLGAVGGMAVKAVLDRRRVVAQRELLSTRRELKRRERMREACTEGARVA